MGLIVVEKGVRLLLRGGTDKMYGRITEQNETSRNKKRDGFEFDDPDAFSRAGKRYGRMGGRSGRFINT